MSLGRSITKSKSKRNRDDSARLSLSKSKISAPIALISTTNMISYTAPSLRTSLSQGSMSSSSSGPSSPTSLKSPGIYPPPPEDSDSPTMQPNHLSAYFTSVALPPVRSQSTKVSKSASAESLSSRPRHPSMPPPPTKSAARKTQWPPMVQPPKELHSARGMSGQHPFGAELAQVAELAEEMAGGSVGDAEEQFMLSRGLQRFDAADYEREIWEGMGGVFEDELPSFGVGWI